jgi:hypothetical protein
LAHEVGHEEHGTLEHAHEQELTPLVIGADVGAERGHPFLHGRLVEQHLGDALVPGHASLPADNPCSPADRESAERILDRDNP